MFFPGFATARLSAVVVFVSVLVPSVASPDSPSIAAATPLPCASSASEPPDLATAFAYDLESPSILRFISALAAVPQRSQKGAFDAAVAADATPAERDVEAAVTARCRSLDETYAASRVAYLLVNGWSLAELGDAKRFQTFMTVVSTALSALADGAGLSAEQRTAALLPFAGIPALVEPSPAPSPSGMCAQPDRHVKTLHVFEPSYPPLAVMGATSGIVHIIVSLSDSGDVRFARVRDETLGNRIGGGEIYRASILAAVATTYAPALKDCRPIAGHYVFNAEYRQR